MNALKYLVNENTTGTATQDVEITYNTTTVSYTITRELEEGGNISHVEKHFINAPYLEDDHVKYVDELSTLYILFTSYDSTYYDLDQLLWEMEEGETTTTNVLIEAPDTDNKEIEITIKLVENSIDE